jgi:redox-sensitive bicupin YhaK (pirin superfamily)
MEEKNEMPDALVIRPREHDLGDFTVRRLLPVAQRRMVGPFVFFDHMGPADFPPGHGINVRPHPHIGLATITFLFDGQILHRDSLGSHQTIDPGDLNWMIAGSGITHSERVTDDKRATGQKLHGLQLWIALPVSAEECAPEFFHYPAADLPKGGEAGAAWTLIAGSAFGETSPAKTYSPMAYLDIKLEAGACFQLPEGISEKAVYLIEGDIEIECQPLAPGELAAWNEGESLSVIAREDSHLVMIGGEPLPEPRTIFWNFVSSSKDRLEQAKQDWKAGRFPKVPGDEIEFIPLPD